MNEKAVNQVISDYAVETANLRIQVATLQAELEQMQANQNKENKKEEEK